MCFAGTPPTIEYGCTSLFTKDPAAIMQPSPNFTPSIILTEAPIQTSLPINVLYGLFIY